MTFVVAHGDVEGVSGVAVNASTRGLLDGLLSPRPIIAELPSIYQEDDFCARMMSAFDDVLAPIFSTLDCLDSYFDAALAPDDFVDWLASWVGVDIDETWTLARRRQLTQQAVSLYRVRGTAGGLAEHVTLYAGVRPEVEDSGGCDWSESANTPLPGLATPHLTVRLVGDDLTGVKRSTVERIVAASRPAHVPFDLEITSGPSRVEEPQGSPAVPLDAGTVSDAVGDPDAPGAVDLPGSERIEMAAPGIDDAEPSDGRDPSTPEEKEPPE